MMTTSKCLWLLFLSALPLTPGFLGAQDVFQAVAGGDRSRVESLLAHEPGLANAVDPRGLTPLTVATLRGDREMMNLLFDAGADPLGTVEGSRLSPLDAAFQQDCQRGGTGLLSFFLERGTPFDPDSPFMGRSRLDIAVTFGNQDVVRLLLDEGAEVDIPGPSGGTPLAWAARRGHGEIVELLLQSGADPAAVDGLGNPALRFAVENGHLDVVRALLDAGAGVDFVDTASGMTLLHLAALYGHQRIVEALLAKDLPVDPLDAEGRTPLFYAAGYGHRAVGETLRRAGADPAGVGYERAHPSPWLKSGIVPGEGVGWFLANRGVALKTANHLLVFDPEEFGVTRPTDPGLANGFITPEEVGEEDLLVFYSAYHGYVDEPAYIHTIVDSVRSVTYLHNAGDEFRGSERALFLDPHENRELGDVRFSTIGTMASMASLAYLMEVDGLMVYYQGFGADDLTHYLSELEALGTARPLDLALLPIPDDGVEAAEDYLRIFLERYEPEAIALHTPPHQIGILPAAVELLRRMGFEGRIFFPTHPGDEFVLDG